MNIVISHAYSNANKGDAALLSVLIQDVKRQFKGAHITVLTLENVKPGTRFEGTTLHPSFMYFALNTHKNRIAKLLYATYIVLTTLGWAITARLFKTSPSLSKNLQQIATIYAEADLIIPVGGGYLRSNQSLVTTINLGLMLHPLLLARILQKPTMLYTQSVGPFKWAIDRVMAGFILRKVNLIILREEKSRKLLQSMGITQNVVRSVDSGFLLESKGKAGLRTKFALKKDTLLVGVTVRKWLDADRQAKYEACIARLLDYAVTTYKAEVVLIPQVTEEFNKDDDRKASQDVYNLMEQKSHAHVIVDGGNHYTTKAMYDDLDIIVGTRFHSVIFSLTSHVPALAVEYEHKTSGIMEDLGLGKWVVKMEDVEDELIQHKFDALIAERKTYIAHLQKVLPPYVQKARTAIELVDEAYKEALTQRA